MVNLIAEHSEGTIVLRGMINDNLIITNKWHSISAAIAEFHLSAIDRKNVDISKVDFQITHEFTDEKVD